MAHICQEITLASIRRFGRLTSRDQISFRLLSFRNDLSEQDQAPDLVCGVVPGTRFPLQPHR